jgi:DivIVA domain-containing protein
VTKDAGEDKNGAAADAAAAEEYGFGELRHYVPADLLDVSFPVSVRGYDRRAVDAYVERVASAIAELKVRASPPAAVRHALEQASQQVHGLLQSARQTAEEIVASARQEADERTARAKAETAELVVNTDADTDRIRAEANAFVASAHTEAAETLATAKAEAAEILAEARAGAQRIVAAAHAEAEERLQRLSEEQATLQHEAEGRMQELESSTESIWNERTDFLADLRRMASALVEFADAAGDRFPNRQAVELDVEETELTQRLPEPMPAEALLDASPDGADTGSARQSSTPSV